MKIIAVDFDGCLSLNAKYPKTGDPNQALFEYLIDRKEHGDVIILWSCRYGHNLQDAISFCNQNGLTFDCVNENHPSVIRKIGTDTRKIYADLYIDNLSKSPWAITHYKPKKKMQLQGRKAKIVR